MVGPFNSSPAFSVAPKGAQGWEGGIKGEKGKEYGKGKGGEFRGAGPQIFFPRTAPANKSLYIISQTIQDSAMIIIEGK